MFLFCEACLLLIALYFIWKSHSHIKVVASISVQGPGVCIADAKECNVQNTGVMVITVHQLKDLVQLHWIIEVIYVHRAYKDTNHTLKWCDI